MPAILAGQLTARCVQEKTMTTLASAISAHYKLVDMSLNAKTGPMPAVYASKATCPPTCGLYDQCYGKSGPTALHWAKDTGKSFADLLEWVATLPISMWRYGVVGDFPGNGVTLCRDSILKLARANKKRPVLAYTHYPVTPDNLETIKAANKAGFALNVSCDSLDDIKAAYSVGVPVVTYTASDDTRKAWVDDGVKYVTCPNQASKAKPQCIKCKMCAKSGRDYVIVFRAHGTQKGKILGVV